MNAALLRLFNGVKVSKKKKENKIKKSVLKRTIKNGYVLHPSIDPKDKTLDAIEKVVGISGKKANASFHKSWKVVQESSNETLVLQQILHYITTYGFQNMGIFSDSTVYIPDEVLKVPKVKKMPLTVVKAMTSKDILKAIVNLGSGIALLQETLDDIMIIVEASKFDNKFVEEIKNRELKALLYDFYGICPSEPVEYLRYVVSKLTDESLLIKNNELIEKIKGSSGKFLDELIKNAPQDLASIFFRFKPLFLAMKTISRRKDFFNRLRKQANKMHKSMPEDYLNNVTAHIKNKDLSMSTLKKKVASATVFRKIRLAYALNFRLNSPEAIVYRVRNGRGWASDFNWASGFGETTKDALKVVVNSIADDVRKNVDGKDFYIPSTVNYALPATEKQFTGNLPTGSYVTVPEDLIFGIHWTNTQRSIDLDLSLVSIEGKIGWDGGYRTEGKNILFSGDVTNAPKPKGASELFYIKKGEPSIRVLMVNYFNYEDDDPVQCKIIVGQEKVSKFGKNYMLNPNKIIASTNINISKKQNVLGLVANVDGENRAYFANVSIGNSITSSMNANSERTRQYMISSLINSLSLKDILVMAGANVAEEKPEDDFIDLSPEALDKSTIIDVIKPQ